MQRKFAIISLVALIAVSLLFFAQCDAPEEDDPLEGCFIATAAYGTPSAEQIDVLRQFRDESLSKSSFGVWFIKNYYRFSPPIADFIAEREVLRTLVREYLIDPTVNIIRLTENRWADK